MDQVVFSCDTFFIRFLLLSITEIIRALLISNFENLTYLFGT